MAPTAMTLSDLEGYFCCLKPFSSHTCGNITRINYGVFTCESDSAYDLQCFIWFIETEGLLIINDVRCRSGNISETVQNRHCYYRLL